MTRRSISLFRRIERALETIAQGSTPLETIRGTAQFLVENFSQDLGIPGGRIYAQDNGSYELVTTFGEVAKAPIGLRIPRTYPQFDLLLDVGCMLTRRSDPRLDPRLEADVGTREWFAAIVVADGLYVLSFDVDEVGEEVEEGLVSTLNIIRLAINQKLREDRMRAILEDARRIQTSILPRRLPRPSGFQLAARTEPAEIVGGDFYDAIVLADTVFDMVIADATGHGLPAALQVRDVFTGLRMGLSREFKLTRTLERLNRIIHRSRLSTKFVSLFLAEIDISGSVIYCNAGHPPAILVRHDGRVERLSTGGLLLGPTADARYSIGLTRLEPGDLLALYTDGITEAREPDQDCEFSEERLVEALVGMRTADPRRIVDRVFEEVARFTGLETPEDDQTLYLVQRRPLSRQESPS